MCGIVGFIGNKTPAHNLIKILKRLEYRGYDSSGLAYLSGKKINAIKAAGEISNLENKVNNKLQVSLALCHTRWATHGAPTEINTHPHLSVNGVWAVVHNGIIENYLDLKCRLKLKDKILSQTDTAVLTQFLEERNVQTINDFINAFKLVQGSFAIAAINKTSKALFLAKNKSPLYVAENNGKFLVASDPVCFSGFSKAYYELKDNEFALISHKKLQFYNFLGEKIVKNEVKLENVEDEEINKFPHFMLKEIYETKPALLRVCNIFSSPNMIKILKTIKTNTFERFCFIGCGTAYHASLMGAKIIEKIARIPAEAIVASEFIYSNPILNNKTLYIFVSQSGETADTISALTLVKNAGCQTLALTNVLYSTLAKSADIVLPVCAGREISVASTKAYTCQISILYLLANFIAGGIDNFNLAIKNLKNAANAILDFDKLTVDRIATMLSNKNEAIFIGKGLDSITAQEASLKLKEVSYINSSSYPSGELKHGFLALITTETPLIAVITQPSLLSKTLNSSNEAASRGANVILVSQCNEVNANITIKNLSDENLMPVMSIVPLQYLAYLVSIKRGINPDKPRNLAKSVTVE